MKTTISAEEEEKKEEATNTEITEVASVGDKKEWIKHVFAKRKPEKGGGGRAADHSDVLQGDEVHKAELVGERHKWIQEQLLRPSLSKEKEEEDMGGDEVGTDKKFPEPRHKLVNKRHEWIQEQLIEKKTFLCASPDFDEGKYKILATSPVPPPSGKAEEQQEDDDGLKVGNDEAAATPTAVVAEAAKADALPTPQPLGNRKIMPHRTSLDPLKEILSASSNEEDSLTIEQTESIHVGDVESPHSLTSQQQPSMEEEEEGDRGTKVDECEDNQKGLLQASVAEQNTSNKETDSSKAMAAFQEEHKVADLEADVEAIHHHPGSNKADDGIPSTTQEDEEGRAPESAPEYQDGLLPSGSTVVDGDIFHPTTEEDEDGVDIDAARKTDDRELMSNKEAMNESVYLECTDHWEDLPLAAAASAKSSQLASVPDKESETENVVAHPSTEAFSDADIGNAKQAACTTSTDGKAVSSHTTSASIAPPDSDFESMPKTAAAVKQETIIVPIVDTDKSPRADDTEEAAVKEIFATSNSLDDGAKAIGGDGKDGTIVNAGNDVSSSGETSDGSTDDVVGIETATETDSNQVLPVEKVATDAVDASSPSVGENTSAVIGVEASAVGEAKEEDSADASTIDVVGTETASDMTSGPTLLVKGATANAADTSTLAANEGLPAAVTSAMEAVSEGSITDVVSLAADNHNRSATGVPLKGVTCRKSRSESMSPKEGRSAVAAVSSHDGDVSGVQAPPSGAVSEPTITDTSNPTGSKDVRTFLGRDTSRHGAATNKDTAKASGRILSVEKATADVSAATADSADRTVIKKGVNPPSTKETVADVKVHDGNVAEVNVEANPDASTENAASSIQSEAIRAVSSDGKTQHGIVAHKVTEKASSQMLLNEEAALDVGAAITQPADEAAIEKGAKLPSTKESVTAVVGSTPSVQDEARAVSSVEAPVIQTVVQGGNSHGAHVTGETSKEAPSFKDSEGLSVEEVAATTVTVDGNTVSGFQDPSSRPATDPVMNVAAASIRTANEAAHVVSSDGKTQHGIVTNEATEKANSQILLVKEAAAVVDAVDHDAIEKEANLSSTKANVTSMEVRPGPGAEVMDKAVASMKNAATDYGDSSRDKPLVRGATARSTGPKEAASTAPTENFISKDNSDINADDMERNTDQLKTDNKKGVLSINAPIEEANEEYEKGHLASPSESSIISDLTAATDRFSTFAQSSTQAKGRKGTSVLEYTRNSVQRLQDVKEDLMKDGLLDDLKVAGISDTETEKSTSGKSNDKDYSKPVFVPVSNAKPNLLELGSKCADAANANSAKTSEGVAAAKNDSTTTAQGDPVPNTTTKSAVMPSEGVSAANTESTKTLLGNPVSSSTAKSSAMTLEGVSATTTDSSKAAQSNSVLNSTTKSGDIAPALIERKDSAAFASSLRCCDMDAALEPCNDEFLDPGTGSCRNKTVDSNHPGITFAKVNSGADVNKDAVLLTSSAGNKGIDEVATTSTSAAAANDRHAATASLVESTTREGEEDSKQITAPPSKAVVVSDVPGAPQNDSSAPNAIALDLHKSASESKTQSLLHTCDTEAAMEKCNAICGATGLNPCPSPDKGVVGSQRQQENTTSTAITGTTGNDPSGPAKDSKIQSCDMDAAMEKCDAVCEATGLVPSPSPDKVVMDTRKQQMDTTGMGITSTAGNKTPQETKNLKDMIIGGAKKLDVFGPTTESKIQSCDTEAAMEKCSAACVATGLDPYPSPDVKGTGKETSDEVAATPNADSKVKGPTNDVAKQSVVNTSGNVVNETTTEVATTANKTPKNGDEMDFLLLRKGTNVLEQARRTAKRVQEAAKDGCCSGETTTTPAAASTAGMDNSLFEDVDKDEEKKDATETKLGKTEQKVDELTPRELDLSKPSFDDDEIVRVSTMDQSPTKKSISSETKVVQTSCFDSCAACVVM